MKTLNFSLRCLILKDEWRKKDLEKMKNSIFNQDLIKSFTDDYVKNSY